MKRHARQHKRTADEDQQKFATYLKTPLGARKLSEIGRKEIAAIHSSITAAEKGITANRVLSLVSSVFDKAWAKLSISHRNPVWWPWLITAHMAHPKAGLTCSPRSWPTTF